MSKSSINQLSKRQILESLYQEQTQGNATLSRLFTALARTMNVNPEDLAKNFADQTGNHEFISKFNKILNEMPTQASNQQHEDHSAHSHEADKNENEIAAE
jgi:hypothetical protein